MKHFPAKTALPAVQALKALLSVMASASMIVVTGGGSAAAATAAESSDLDILKAYASDYEQDAFLTDEAVFGIKVGEVFYTVESIPTDGDQEANVSVRKGEPEKPTFFFVLQDSALLQKLDAGKVHALTLAGKARSSDYAPLDIDAMEGFAPPEWFGDKITRLLFHFWTRGNPEIVPFASQETRIVHGASLGAFYYQPGFRSAWIDIQPGQHANEGEEDTSNPFPSMVIMIEGEVSAIIGDREVNFTAGNMMLIPAGVPHEFVNQSDERAFGVLLMFGEGA